ncbi:hypothetical protein RSOLAG1IB_03088 [Rhizoctonia solani AG-1 IB]|uniref:Uncharacterized protein n=1 Tax=Thanatephorus cucumeris (strain AG1-IB / isolate 7/3/14) TaxID=1108050 RepID=A0A0B7FQ98_THACB|nr:hypothetical protein RSOLAG1IB_03088 [Rhizoctonia solani AG-1 IB]
MSSKPTLNDYGNCNREAQKDGTFAGVTAGLLGALIGSRVFGFNRNMSVFAGLLTGVGSGYYFSRAFLSSRLAHLERQRLLAEQRSQGAGPIMS